jgi:Tol biopolymer transport system component
MSADGSHQRRLTHESDAMAPCFSPDGRKIIFASTAGVILVMNATTGSIASNPLITTSGIPVSEDWGRRPRRREPEDPS